MNDCVVMSGRPIHPADGRNKPAKTCIASSKAVGEKKTHARQTPVKVSRRFRIVELRPLGITVAR